MVAGTGRFDTEVMTLLGARAFTKTGAEGVFCAALPELGLGLAVKADDGATRAAQVMIAALIAKFLPMSDAERARFETFARADPAQLERAGSRADAGGGGVGVGRRFFCRRAR